MIGTAGGLLRGALDPEIAKQPGSSPAPGCQDRFRAWSGCTDKKTGSIAASCLLSIWYVTDTQAELHRGGGLEDIGKVWSVLVTCFGKFVLDNSIWRNQKDARVGDSIDPMTRFIIQIANTEGIHVGHIFIMKQRKFDTLIFLHSFQELNGVISYSGNIDAHCLELV